MAEIPKKSNKNVKIVIFCGGKGTRMWPITNVSHPKQFDAILGNTSFFRQTIERVLSRYAAKDIFISTGKSFGEIISQQAPEIPTDNIILEPVMRDNLGAVGLAAQTIAHRFPDSVIIFLWGADHSIKKDDVFLDALQKAADLAYEKNKIVHVDAKPTFASVHNGWVQIGEKISDAGAEGIFDFIKQVEKPDLETAKKFFASGNYLIHTGYMACRPEILLSYYKTYASQNFALLEKIGASIGKPSEKQVLEEEYPKMEKISVDNGLFEKLPAGTQWELPVDFGWVDLGTWELLYHGLDKDKDGNVVIGKAELIDVSNSLIFSKEGKTTGVIGVKDMVIIDTENGLLVCPLSQAPKVKELYKQIFEK